MSDDVAQLRLALECAEQENRLLLAENRRLRLVQLEQPNPFMDLYLALLEARRREFEVDGPPNPGDNAELWAGADFRSIVEDATRKLEDT